MTAPAALADRYETLRVLGEGGMSVVYLARDRRHEREVALKVVRPGLATSVAAERFRREIALATRLQHPHIVTAYDSGVADGVPWYAMPHIEGESLRGRLQREGQLRVDEVVRIGCEVLSALAYAHGRGVLHRDVKPENILLSRDGTALLADFGVARGLDAGAREEPGGSALTATGLTVGTPTYMSPEQAAGARDIDGRSDLYALGCVLYEMLAGEPPFTGSTPQAVIAKRFTTPASSLRVFRDCVPPALDAAIARALRRAPADRFESAGAFAEALRTSATPEARGTLRAFATRHRRPALLAAAALAMLTTASPVIPDRGSRPAVDGDPARAGREPPSAVAVLPFTDVGGGADGGFSDAVADDIRGRLASATALRVVASPSSGVYRGAVRPPESIARELGARYLVLGKVQWRERPGGTARVRVAIELVDAGRAPVPTVRWAASVEADLDDPFRTQGEIAARVATSLAGALGGHAAGPGIAPSASSRRERAAQP